MEDVSTRNTRGRPLRWVVAAAFVVAVCVGLRLACAPTTAPALRRVDAPVVTEKPRRAAIPEAPAAEPAPPPAKPNVESAKTRTIRIVVVADADGAPVEGADVQVDETRRHRAERPDKSTDYEETIVRAIDAKSGADGVVVGAISGFEASLVVKKSGFLVVRRRIESDAENVRVPLVASIVVRGRVVFAETHEPAPGVAVRAWDTGKMQGFTEDAVLDDVVTGPDGRFELAGVAKGREFRVAAAKPGWRTADATMTLTESVPEIELVLGDGGVMFGVVYGADGAPLADVAVFQIRPDMDDLPRVRDDGPFMSYARDDLVAFVFPPVRTDAAGRFEFRGVRLPVDGVPQPRQAAARLANGRSARGEPATFTRQGERQQRDVRFTKASSITVTVKSKTPLPEGAEIRCQGNGPNSRDATRPAPVDGSPVVFDDLPANTYFVSVGTEGGGFFSGWGLTRHVKLKDGESASVDIVLDDGSRIEGHVVDPDGRGIPAVRVEFSAFSSSDGLSVRVTDVTKSDGAFSLRGLPSIAGELRASPDSFAGFDGRGERSPPIGVESVEMKDVRPGGPALTITLRRLGRLVGRVKPVPKNRQGSVSARAGGRSGGAEIEVADDGRFECAAPLVGEASVAWFDFQTKPLTVIDLPAIASGETKDVGEIALESGVAFDGKLLDADGRGVVAAHIHHLESWAGFDDTSTDVSGRFRLDALPKHPLLIQVRATPATPMTVLRVDPSVSPTTFVVGPGALVSGHVLDADGKPVAGAHVSLRPVGIADDAADANGSAVADDEGAYAIRVQTGRAKLRASAGSDARWTSSEWIEIPATDGEKRTLEFRLR
jgi:hypothetical protein